MKSLLTALLLGAAFACAAQPSAWVVADPAGDDHWAGNLVYPRRSDLRPGDLDLRSLRVRRERDGVWFDATFANPIRDPATVPSDTGGGDAMSYVARHGFYAFNLDLYLDTDGVTGSGNTATLPGRGATIDAATAWERAVVLTPRPELMRRLLVETLSRHGSAAGVEAMVAKSVFFPTRIRVNAKTVSFFVPAEFLGSDDPGRWAVTAFVTLAQLNVGLDWGPLERLAVPRDGGRFGVLPPAAGRPLEAFGTTQGDAPTAVVDLLDPQPGRQARALAGAAPLVGVRFDGRPVEPSGAGVAATPKAEPAAAPPASLQSLLEPAAATGAAPAVSAAAAAPPAVAPPVAAPSVAAPAVRPAPPAPAPAAATPPSTTVAPAAAAVPVPARPDGAAPRPPRDAAFYEEQEQRLRTLKRLRDRGLITEQEYEAKRREVLDLL